MIDPRNLPYAHVQLSRLSPHELPYNALKQYHNYTAKRKSRDSTPSEPIVANVTGLSAQPPPVHYSFASGESDHQHTGFDSLIASEDINANCLTDQSLLVNYSCTVGSLQRAEVNALNVSKETCGTVLYAHHLPAKYSCATGENDHLLSSINSLASGKDTSVATVPVPSKRKNDSCLASWELVTKPGGVQPCRRNSLASTTSSHSTGSSKGKSITASVRLSPVTWHRSRSVSRQVVGFEFENGIESNDERTGDILVHSILPGTKSTRDLSCFLDTNLKPSHFSHEDLCTVTSTSSTADVSERSTLSDESATPTGFSSFKKHVMCGGCEEMWPDFSSYSPPESPSQGSENAVSKEHEILPIKTDIATWQTGTNEVEMKEEPELSKSIKGEKSDDILGSFKCGVRRLSVQHNELLSPKIKLVPLDRNNYKQNERRLSYSNASPPKRKSFSPKGDIVIRLDDVGEKLKPHRNGGLTIAAGRYTSSGRKILSNYSEEALAKSVMKRVIPTERKRRRKNKVAKGSEPSRGNKSGTDYKPGRNNKKWKPRERKKSNLSCYENLKFKELNTIPRMSVRYKVAFTKWPYVFSGALDLINQRLSNQNAFWNSIRS